MSDVILSIRSLTRKYEDFNALQGIDLEIRRGEFVALLGPSGCGKTTLLRCIGGFTQPTSGEILIDGASMLNIPPQQRPVNTVFQNYALFPHMTVAQNVAYGPRRAKDARQDINKRVMESLEMVGLASLGDRYPTQLSGGQQQRVALARAIINRPQVLLLDEPLGALDLKLRKHMQLELKKLQQQLGITFVFVTHDQEEALVMADRIAVMNGGRLEQLGTGEQLYHTPASLFVADFIGDANFIDVDIESCGTLRQRGSGSLFGRLALPPGRGAYRMLARPSQLSFVPPDCTNTAIKFQAMVMRTVSTGDALRVFVKLADGAEVAVKLPESVGQLSLHEGQSVHLGLLNPTPNFFPLSA